MPVKRNSCVTQHLCNSNRDFQKTQQLSWKNFPVKTEKSLCKLFGPKYAPNSVHNSVTIYSAKVLPAFWCVKGASPPRRRGGWRGGLRGRLPSHGRGVFFYRAGDYQIAPKPPEGRLWVVAVPPPEKAFIHGVSW